MSTQPQPQHVEALQEVIAYLPSYRWSKRDGQRFREIREFRGLSQRQLAFRNGYDRASAAYISRIEAGERTPSFRLQMIFCILLDTPFDYLVHNVGSMRSMTLDERETLLRFLTDSSEHMSGLHLRIGKVLAVYSGLDLVAQEKE